MKKISVLVCVLIIAAFFFGCRASNSSESSSTGGAKSSADWPNGTITIMCGSAAGGSTDLANRLVAAELEKKFGVPVIVENVTGSAGWVCWNRVLKNTPKDGYYLTAINLNTALGHYRQNDPLPETIDDFILLANQAYDCGMIGILKDETRFNDFASFVKYAQNNEVLIATNSSDITSGAGGIVKWMEKTLGCKFINVPIDGATDELQLFHSKNIDVRIADVSDAYRDSEMRAIVTFGEERRKYMPDVPTVRELGYDYEIFSCRGYAYAAGVDPVIVEKMQNALAEVIVNPAVISKMDEYGIQTILYTGEEYKKLITDAVDQRLEVWGIAK